MTQLSSLRRRAQPGQTIAITAACLLLIVILGTVKSWLEDHRQPLQRQALQVRDVSTLDDDNLLCRKVHRAADQCAWIKEYCEDDDVGLLSYLTLYYCRLPKLKGIAFIIIASWSFALFSTIGIAASDFFCVNLSTISNILGMSESMAGVTFLAFGNGSPDVFSTFAAIRTNSGSLAVGELIGAAGFITAVVSGSMALVRPFKVARRSFVRDVGFFIVAVSFSMVFVANGKLELWECATMVGFYVFYVVVVVIWHWWLSQRRKRREQQEIARGYYVDPSAEDELDFESEYADDEEATRARRMSRTSHPSEGDLIDLENAETEREDFDELEEETERDKWMGELSSNMRLTRTPIGERRSVFNPIRPSLAGALEFQSVLRGLRKSRNISSFPVHLRRFSDEPALTLAQQQSRTRSTTVGPHTQSATATISRDRDISPGPSNSHSQLDGESTEQIGRGRAKSANAADLLGLSPTAWKGRQRSRSNLSSPRPASRYSDHENLPVPGQEPPRSSASSPQLHEQSSPPLLLVEPPAEERTRSASPARRSRTDSGDLLAPPEPKSPQQRDDPPSNLDGTGRPSKPQLRITPPTPLPDTSQFPPLRSRSPSQSSGSRTPKPSNFLLGDTIPSPESMQPIDSRDMQEPRPWRWWPYSVLVPPETILRTLFPTVQSWRDKSWLGKLTGLFSAPSFLLLTITLPVVEPEAPDTDEVSGQDSPPSTLDKNKPSMFPSGNERHSPSLGSGPDALAHVAIGAESQQHHKSVDAHQNQDSSPKARAEPHPHAAVQSPHEWNRWLVLIQCFTAPYFVLLTVWANFFEADPDWLLKPSLYCLLGSTILFAFMLLTTRPNHPPRWHIVLCFAGFAVSVAWISSIANEVVGVLKAIGVIFNISDAILGLTIFAVGNSMGDLVADITVARLGYPVMALSACFGGPMLNILLGIGLSGLYMVINKADHRHHRHPDEGLKFKPYKVEISTTLLISAIALLVTLVGLLIAVPLNKWTMDRKIGWGLIILWVIATAGNLGVELSGWGSAEA